MKKLSILLLLALVTSCKSSTSGTKDTSTEDQSISFEKPERKPVSLPEPFYCEEIAEVEDVEDTASYKLTTILKYEQIENCVCIKYQYSGCTEANRLLVWDGTWNESNRPEVDMKLLVRNAGLCDELLTDSACFSMKRMKLVGNEVLVFFNEESNNILLNFNYAGDQ